MVTHTPNCPGGTCDDPETTFLCDVCGREFAACCGVSESETCDDCEGKMELARLKYSDGISIAIESVDGVPALVTFTSGEHAVSAYARDTLQLLDSANLNTTANELRAKLEEAQRQLSEVSAIAKATMGERETLKLKLAEREDDLVRAGKLWDETHRQLEEAHQTISQLRQADTVRPAARDSDTPHCATCECDKGW